MCNVDENGYKYRGVGGIENCACRPEEEVCRVEITVSMAPVHCTYIFFLYTNSLYTKRTMYNRTGNLATHM